MKVDRLQTHIEQIIERELSLNHHRLQIVGSNSTLSASYLLSQIYSKKINDLPHVVVFSSEQEAVRFKNQMEFFDPLLSSFYLPSFDVSPYSSIYPNQRIVSERIYFLHRAQHAKAGQLFITSISALQQKTIPFRILSELSQKFSKDDDLPANIAEYLNGLGYSAVPLVEDYGQFAVRGGICDIFSPAHEKPVRIELFGDTIESLRFFDPDDQKSLDDVSSFYIVPAKEAVYTESQYETLIQKFRASVAGREVDRTELEEMLHSLMRKQYFPGLDFLLPFFYEKLDTVFEHFNESCNAWFIDELDIQRKADDFIQSIKADFSSSSTDLIRPLPEDFFIAFEDLEYPLSSREFYLSAVQIENISEHKAPRQVIEYKSQSTNDFSNLLMANPSGSEPWLRQASQKIEAWQEEGYTLFVAARNKSQSERIQYLFERMDVSAQITNEDEYLWQDWTSDQKRKKSIYIIPRTLSESLRLIEDKIIFLRDEDFFGKKERLRQTKAQDEFNKKAKRMSFGDLKPGDLVVHTLHGVGLYEGLKVMNIQGIDSEFIQLAYKDKDKLYLPVYRINQLQKYSGANASMLLDKLGGTGWEKVKTKVKGALKDIAAELLQLYARRAEMHRPAFSGRTNDYTNFENAFPYDETLDQLNAIDDIMKDMTSTKSMDRLVCGDVGFGKTEIAMRAAFMSAQDRRQVAVLAPTTVLTFQHFETFKKRFKGWPLEIRALNRFVPPAEAKKTLQEVKEGKVDILIGTHRILSKDVEFKNLGLLIVDEEHKFGVTHKEKVKKLKNSVDTLTLSATPIPRTLNMSLVGVRDLSIINTPPVDRLPTRTFISKFDNDTIRKAIQSEIARGGQIYFIHNRVQSIYALADELREIVPEARIKVGHGQMEEHELEETMVAFFQHQIDILICTTIVESGMDVSIANTMFIDQAHMLGLSQLYQLRGRVGRSKQRAYCYLLLPRGRQIDKDAQERLKVLQENTALGSGLKVAQYDLELRGSGNILGEDQSGHVNSVGYEMFMDLLQEAIQTARGEPVEDNKLDPEINLKIPAMIPDKYIPDIRLRLGYYKALSEIQDTQDLDQIESELKDQFGPIPEPVINLMGIMLIRSLCKKIGIRDVTAGVKTIALIFTPNTPIKTETFISLAMRENKKYSLSPDNRLTIRINNITWSSVYEELGYLKTLI